MIGSEQYNLIDPVRFTNAGCSEMPGIEGDFIFQSVHVTYASSLVSCCAVSYRHIVILNQSLNYRTAEVQGGSRTFLSEVLADWRSMRL
jgi:hypothetical protein